MGVVRVAGLLRFSARLNGSDTREAIISDRPLVGV